MRRDSGIGSAPGLSSRSQPARVTDQGAAECVQGAAQCMQAVPGASEQ